MNENLLRYTKADRKRDAFKRLTEEARVRGIDRKFARAQIRKVITEDRNTSGYQHAGKPTRRMRKWFAKYSGEKFIPMYNN